LLTGALLLVPWSLRAEPNVPPRGISLAVAPGASLELDGDSTLHRYSAKAHGMEVEVGLDPTTAAGAQGAPNLEALILGHHVRMFELRVPVDQLTSGEKGLDQNMRKALKGGQYRQIRFQMDSYDVTPPRSGGPAFAVMLHGRLSLAGVERKVDVGATAVPSQGSIRISGSKDLLMTDYQIKPPVLMLGAIKTANLITVKFNATLQRGIIQ